MAMGVPANRCCGQRRLANSIAVVLNDDFELAALEVLDGVVSTAVADLHLLDGCAVAHGDELVAEGRVDGSIAYAPAGEGGFGYDPVFFIPGLKKPFAQLTAEEKNAISHRADALQQFLAWAGSEQAPTA